VLPGAYLTTASAGGRNPGAAYIRVALVADVETTAEALRRVVEVLT
jgi:aspartate/methionine/tyrosine aminotransferase